MTGRILYYVHHHGAGHAHRAAAICRAVEAAGGPVVTGLSSRTAPDGWSGDWQALPGDADGVDPLRDDVTAGGALHWAPLRHAGLRRRTAAITRHLAREDVRLLVADVSVEVCLLARLHGVPVVVVAQPGDRTDRPHRAAYDLASRVLARTGWPEHWLAKTTHLGTVSRFDGRVAPERPGRRRVLALWGAGGSDIGWDDLTSAATATPDWTWLAVGPLPDRPGPANLQRLGWIDDVWGLLIDVDVVVTHGGQNSVAEVAAARRPAVVVAQRRPHDEQLATVAALARDGLAEVATSWPAPSEWPRLLAAADARDGEEWARWSSGDGARRAAAVLTDLAADVRVPL